MFNHLASVNSDYMRRKISTNRARNPFAYKVSFHKISDHNKSFPVRKADSYKTMQRGKNIYQEFCYWRLESTKYKPNIETIYQKAPSSKNHYIILRLIFKYQIINLTTCDS